MYSGGGGGRARKCGATMVMMIDNRCRINNRDGSLLNLQ